MTILSILSNLVQSNSDSLAGAGALGGLFVFGIYGSAVAIFVLSMLVWFVLAILAFVLPVVVLVLMIYFTLDAMQRDFGVEESTQQLLWILVIWIASLPGLILYYFLVMQKYPKKLIK